MTGKNPILRGRGSWMGFRALMDIAVNRVELQFFCHPERVMVCVIQTAVFCDARAEFLLVNTV
jgi:hypothetical protein